MNKKEFIKDFEGTILLAKARAYSKLSLERPLSKEDVEGFRGTMDKLRE